MLASSQTAHGRVTVESPWSGQTLPIHAYGHAVLVWFSLFNFWHESYERHVVPSEATARMETIREGFLNGRRRTVLRSRHKYFVPAALELLDSVEEMMVAP